MKVGLQLIVFAEYLRFGVDEDPARQSIHDHQVARADLFRGLRRMHEHGNAQGASEDRGVGGEAALFHNQPANAMAFQLRHDGGEQLARDKHTPVRKGREARLQILRQMLKKTFTHISQIGGSLAKVRICEPAEQVHEMLDRVVECSFHIDPLFKTKVTDCIPQCRVAH